MCEGGWLGFYGRVVDAFGGLGSGALVRGLTGFDAGEDQSCALVGVGGWCCVLYAIDPHIVEVDVGDDAATTQACIMPLRI